MTRTVIWVVPFVLLSSASLRAQEGSAGPLGVPREILDAVRSELQREDPRPRVSALAALHSLRATPAYDEAAALVAGWAREAGLEVETEDFPSDGQTRYGAFLSEPGWKVESGELDLLRPSERRLASFRDSPLALAWFSGPSDVTAELVDVGPGISDADYEGKSVRGKVVLADGPHAVVHRLAVYERGALGVVSGWHLFPERYPDVLSSDGAGIRPWTGPEGQPPGFVFSVSARVAAELRSLLAAGDPVAVRARVRTATVPSRYRVVSARIPGTSRPSEEVLLVNHLDSTSPGAVHNAGAALTLLDAASALRALVAKGELAPPARTLRFLWVPEHRGTMAYLLAHPELRTRVVAAMNVDMPTARHGATGAVTHLYRTPDATPSFADDVFGELLEWVRDGNTVQLGTDVFSYPIVSEFGSRESFEASVVRFEGLSDHVEFIVSGIPMGFFGAWPFEPLGTTADTLDVYDATQAKRMSFVLAAGAYAVAAASQQDVVRMGEVFLKRARARLLEETSRRMVALSRKSRGEELDEAYTESVATVGFAVERERRALATLARIGDLEPERLRSELEEAGERARKTLASYYRVRGGDPARVSPASRSAREAAVPEKTGALEGPLTSDVLRDRLERALTEEESALFRRPPYAAFEAWNFVDGGRSLGEIRGALSAEFGEVPFEQVESLFAALERAGLVRFHEAR